ncbi:hypothetical protein E3N88_32781 [Mikania micrantha]|uniref:Uncharacterized protein n=1 Tax=Mikania micrantha TaxID=192012 RepID=A0A5N6MAP2_9ASTR|nr:hypothetical protein E3N88_32781 [Mikania micrantha]
MNENGENELVEHSHRKHSYTRVPRSRSCVPDRGMKSYRLPAIRNPDRDEDVFPIQAIFVKLDAESHTRPTQFAFPIKEFSEFDAESPIEASQSTPCVV